MQQAGSYCWGYEVSEAGLFLCWHVILTSCVQDEWTSRVGTWNPLFTQSVENISSYIHNKHLSRIVAEWETNCHTWFRVCRGMPWTEEVRTFFVSSDQYLFCAGEYDTCRLLDSKYALQCLLGSVSSSLLRTQIRLAFYSCKWGAFYSCNRGAFYSCNCRNDFLLTYNDKLYLTFGVKNERRHELVLAVLWY